VSKPRFNEANCGEPTVSLQATRLRRDRLAGEMTRWLSHLRSERRLVAKRWKPMPRRSFSVSAFLSEHWGKVVTLARFAALEAGDVRAFMAIGAATTLRAFPDAHSGGSTLVRPLLERKAKARSVLYRDPRAPRSAKACRSRFDAAANASPMPMNARRNPCPLDLARDAAVMALCTARACVFLRRSA